MSIASDERPSTMKRPAPLQLKRVAATLLGGVVAAVVMLVVGWVFDQLECLLPAIKAEYDNKAVFRTWPGWTETYMRAHPCWFGFVFAFVYVLLSQSDPPAARARSAWSGASYGAVVFLVGSLPVFALIYAAFQVSLGLLALSWGARNLAQYVLAGFFLGLVVRACRTTQPLYLVDQSSARVAVLNVTLIGDHYRGTICLDETPPELKHLFEEFEENVEGQMFPLADEIEEKIGAIPLKVLFPNGMEACVEDLQVYPSTKRVSFKIRQASTAAG